MKKLLSFNNLIAVFGVIALLLFLTPCYQVKLNDSIQINLNLFQTTFGTNLAPSDVGWIVSCGGLIVVFVFVIIGIVTAIARNFVKGVTLLGAPLFITAGIIAFASEGMVRSANYNAGIGIGRTIYMQGWTIAIGVILCLIGVLALIDGLMSISKPKQKEVY